uniref:(northern house mosquito) hypothetical protein n=1 Tax=Culex pipiens TaxID=7175 RepID=A0A8D8ADK1_CULPI
MGTTTNRPARVHSVLRSNGVRCRRKLFQVGNLLPTKQSESPLHVRQPGNGHRVQLPSASLQRTRQSVRKLVRGGERNHQRWNILRTSRSQHYLLSLQHLPP